MSHSAPPSTPEPHSHGPSRPLPSCTHPRATALLYTRGLGGAIPIRVSGLLNGRFSSAVYQVDETLDIDCGGPRESEINRESGGQHFGPADTAGTCMLKHAVAPAGCIS